MASDTGSEQPASGIGIGLDDVADATGQDPRVRVYVTDRVAPGTSIQRRVKIQNTTRSAQSVRIYTGASRIVDGSFVGENDPSSNELTGWMTIATPRMQLTPGQIETDVVTFAVPKDAAEQEHYGTVWAEIRSAPASGSSVVQVSRVGIRVYLSVGSGNPPASDFTIGTIVSSPGPNDSSVITARLTNTGGRALDINGGATLWGGPGGMAAGPFLARATDTLAPGESHLATIPLPVGISAGQWMTKLTFTSGLIVRSKTVSITLAATVAPPVPAPFGWTPANMLWLTVTLLLIGIGITVTRGGLRRRDPHTEEGRP